MARSFEDLAFGDEIETQPDVSMSQVIRFTDVTGMKAGRFIDHERARKEGLPGAIVPGIMSQGLLAAAVHASVAGATIEWIDTIFRALLPVDSKPTMRIVITDRDEAERTLELDLTIVNEASETRVLGTAKVRCPPLGD